MEAAPGFEPGNKGFADPRLTTWLCRHPFAGQAILLDRFLCGYPVGYPLSTDPLGLTHDQVVADSPVPLRGYDRGVSKDLLKGRQTATAFEPLASERMAQLVDVEAINTT